MKTAESVHQEFFAASFRLLVGGSCKCAWNNGKGSRALTVPEDPAGVPCEPTATNPRAAAPKLRTAFAESHKSLAN